VCNAPLQQEEYIGSTTFSKVGGEPKYYLSKILHIFQRINFSSGNDPGEGWPKLQLRKAGGGLAAIDHRGGLRKQIIIISNSTFINNLTAENTFKGSHQF
jgi:hypothetical protein